MKFEEALIIAEERNGGDFLKFVIIFDKCHLSSVG